jgi:hypothetical protein
VIFNLKNELITLFKSVIENKDEWDGQTRTSAMGYYRTLQSIDSSFLFKVFASVFPKSDSLFNILQKKMFDISFCKQKINEFKKI